MDYIGEALDYKEQQASYWAKLATSSVADSHNIEILGLI